MRGCRLSRYYTKNIFVFFLIFHRFILPYPATHYFSRVENKFGISLIAVFQFTQFKEPKYYRHKDFSLAQFPLTPAVLTYLFYFLAPLNPK